MGANEKHAATYHSGEYTPPVRALRTSYVALRDKDTTSLEEAREEFQRGIDSIRAEAKQEALLEASKALDNDQSAEPGTMKYVHNIIYSVWLTERANQYKENQ